VSEASAVRVALVTAPAHLAESLARSLVEDRIAACVNVLPGVTSIYRWEGCVEEAEEALLVLKVPAGTADTLPAEVAIRHPYDVPEVLLLDVTGGLPEYLAWVRDATEAPA